MRSVSQTVQRDGHGSLWRAGSKACSVFDPHTVPSRYRYVLTRLPLSRIVSPIG